jgi:branched-subunit amino acid aminotransferase/4-amino-4-deoxychorismate lyase
MKADADPNLIVYFGGQYVPMGEARVGILTHALHYGTGVFEGIRTNWDEAQQELRLQVVEQPIDRSELYVCNELFFTGTAVGIAPVVRVDHRPVKDEAIGAVTRELRPFVFRCDARTSAELPEMAGTGLPTAQHTSAQGALAG